MKILENRKITKRKKSLRCENSKKSHEGADFRMKAWRKRSGGFDRGRWRIRFIQGKGVKEVRL